MNFGPSSSIAVSPALDHGEFRLRLRVVVLGQAFDLLDVEYRVALQEGNFALHILAFGVLLDALELAYTTSVPFSPLLSAGSGLNNDTTLVE
jgi:hypothetical protein